MILYPEEQHVHQGEKLLQSLQHLCMMLLENTVQVRRYQQEAVLKATAVRSPLPVVSSILPCPPCVPQVMQTQVQAKGGGGPGGGRGPGIFHPPCHVLHYHMVLALKGLRTTSVSVRGLWVHGGRGWRRHVRSWTVFCFQGEGLFPIDLLGNRIL